MAQRAMTDQPTGEPMFCGDCLSPFPSTSHFCYECGAGWNRRISLSEATQRREERAKAAAEGEPADVVPIRSAVAQPPVPEEKPEFDFERLYRETSQEPPAPERTSKKKIAVAAALVLVVIALGWYQRRLAVYGFDELSRWARNQMLSFTDKDQLPIPPVNATAPRQRHVPAKRVAEPRPVEAVRRPMVVTVQGQPSPMQVTTGGMAVSTTFGKRPQVVPAPLSPLRIRIAPQESLAMLLHSVQPVYPANARAAHVEGTVVLRAVIAADGTVEQVSAVSGDEMLVPAAEAAVRRWLYRPRYVNGTPAEVETDIMLEFRLADTAQVMPVPSTK